MTQENSEGWNVYLREHADREEGVPYRPRQAVIQGAISSLGGSPDSFPSERMAAEIKYCAHWILWGAWADVETQLGDDSGYGKSFRANARL